MTKKDEEEKTPAEGEEPKSEVETFLDELPKEGEEATLEEEGEETPSGSSPEKKPEGAPSSEGDEDKDAKEPPFHTHPRFKKMAKENRELRGKLDEVTSKLDQLLEVKSETPSGEVPQWFVKLYGDNPKLWEEYNNYSAQQREDFEKSVLNKLEARLEEKTKEAEGEQAKWAQWVEDQLVDLEEEGEKFDRKALLKVMDDYTPTDGQGVPDFHKGLQILNAIGDRKTATETQKEKDKARKEVAAKTTSGGGGRTSSSSTIDPKTLRKKSFLDLAQEEE